MGAVLVAEITVHKAPLPELPHLADRPGEYGLSVFAALPRESPPPRRKVSLFVGRHRLPLGTTLSYGLVGRWRSLPMREGALWTDQAGLAESASAGARCC